MSVPDDPKPRDGYHWEPCPKCHGSGKQSDIIYHGPDVPCTFCGGKGRVEVCHDGSDFVGGA